MRSMPKTGEICERSGVYKFSEHVDGSWGCHLTAEEHEIKFAKGERFPPIKSCGKAVDWIFVRDVNLYKIRD